MATSRPGVYTCGSLQGPKDIPSSVTEASAAAGAAGADVAAARGRDTKSLDIPDEIDVSDQEARIGVFVCNCGINIGALVDVPAVRQYAAGLPSVVFSDENLFTCSQDTQEKIKEVILEEKLNRVVVASCSPKTHAPMFMETLEACGLNKYLFEMANIRNQDSWVHANNPDFATKKAKDLVRAAVARAATLKPLHGKVIPINKKALIIGGGIAGMNAALDLARQGFESTIIEKVSEPGGMARKLHHTIEGRDIRVVYSTMDAIDLAVKYPHREVIFPGVGFETTAPTIAAAIKTAQQTKLMNFSVYAAHKTVPPALQALMSSELVAIDGFILPGHVSVIIGLDAYRPFFDRYRIPCVAAGFEPVDIGFVGRQPGPPGRTLR